MKVAIYSRKSKSTDKGESIETQINLCKDYINKISNGKHIEIDEEIVSSYKEKI